jgi:hypothetical protein
MSTDHTAAPVRPAARAASLRRNAPAQARAEAAPSSLLTIAAPPVTGAVAASLRAASPAVRSPAA